SDGDVGGARSSRLRVSSNADVGGIQRPCRRSLHGAGGMYSIHEPDRLPSARYAGDTRADGYGARIDIGELALLDGAGQRQILDRRITDRNDVAALQAVLRDLGGFQVHAHLVAVGVDSPVLPAEDATRARIGRVPGGEGVDVRPAG